MSWQADLAEQARAAMPVAMWHYTVSGAGEGVTAHEAARAWQDVRFAPRVLHDVTHVDLTTTVLDDEVSTPVAVAPTSLQRLAHPEGERAMARGAARAGALHVVSTNAGLPFADVDAGAPWWVQAYLPPTRDDVVPVLGSAGDAGARAVVLTVDTPLPGTKYLPRDEDWEGIDLSWFRCNFPVPSDTRWTADLVPDDIGWPHRTVGLPVVVKGVLRPEDALRCVEAGAAAVWVSNHGGRQLDRARSTRAALPAVAEAVAGRVQVYVDGGITSGLDVLAALALGADAVFLGRLPLQALAAGGEAGVAAALTTLSDELLEGLRLGGCRSTSDARGLLAPESSGRR